MGKEILTLGNIKIEKKNFFLPRKDPYFWEMYIFKNY